VSLPTLRGRYARDRLVLIATLLCAASIAALAVFRDLVVLGVALFVNGLAWITVLSSLQIAAQTSVPAWVRARALSLYIVVFALGMASGSLVWGAVAQEWSTRIALLVAAGAAAVMGVVATRFRLEAGEHVDFTPSAHWPQPSVSGAMAHDRGPVLVTIEYEIDAADRVVFLRTLRQLGESRRRDGALQWDVLEDTEQPGTFLEFFQLDSWLSHLRQHERVTIEEKRLQETLRALHRGTSPPRLRHFVGGAETDLPAARPHAHPDEAAPLG
jgi:hypothetical protein